MTRLRNTVRHAGRAGRMLLPAAALGCALAVVALGSPPRHTSSIIPARPASFAAAIPHTDVRPTAARAARADTSWLGGATTAATGDVVTVYVSSSLPPTSGTAQTWADFIAGLVHGPELAKLTAYIATLDEIADMCGDDALGCYAGNRLAAVGETSFGITPAEVVRHEYGHHVAWNRLNPPWTAVDWGPKNWGSAAGVCRRAANGTAYPGNETDHYRLNPGEAWAETYRLLDEGRAGVSGSGWQLLDASFLPDEAALQAAERDVLRPWTAETRLTFTHRFSARGKRSWSIPITTPLDGDLSLTATLPSGGLQDVVLVDEAARAPIARGLWASASTKRIATHVCGERSLTLRITQRGAYGRVVVSVARP